MQYDMYGEEDHVFNFKYCGYDTVYPGCPARADRSIVASCICDDCLAGQHRAAGRSRCGSDANQGCNQEADVRPPLTVTPSSVMSSSIFTSILGWINDTFCLPTLKDLCWPNQLVVKICGQLPVPVKQVSLVHFENVKALVKSFKRRF